MVKITQKEYDFLRQKIYHLIVSNINATTFDLEWWSDVVDDIINEVKRTIKTTVDIV